MNQYNQKVINCFRDPKNMGKMEKPDGTGSVGNLICGDVMVLDIKVSKDRNNCDFIEDIRFRTFGCVAAISTSSMVTEIAKGKTIDEALKITKDAIVEELGGLPKVKVHCSVLAIDALSEAIFDYLKKNKKNIPDSLKEKHEKIKREQEIMKKKNLNQNAS